MKKLLIFLTLIFVLSSCFFSKENLQIEPTWKIIEEKIITPENKIIKEMPLSNFQNSIHSASWKLNLKEKIDFLETFDTNEEKNKEIFLKSLIWDYKKANFLQKELCLDNKKDLNCQYQEITFNIKDITDSNSNKIYDSKNIWIKIDWEDLTYSKSFNLNLSNNFNHKLNIFKKWYIWYYQKIPIKNFKIEESFEITPVFEKYSLYEKVNINESKTYKTDNFDFVVSSDSFSFKNGKKVSGDIELYFFDTKAQDISFFKLDMFDIESYSLLWSRLINKATSHVKAYKNNEELQIIKPIKVFSNLEKIAFRIDSINLEKIPKNINLSQEQKENFKIPFIWNLKNDSGVWTSTNLKILNSNWDIEFLLY